ncbi:FecR family protein [Chitinophaga jiangningensis]|uniref:FecR family protein n=1 Tax=Chitinophaga jiangningensis TaxID=1419482 RepID=A0A1M7K7Y2_9BACT|nr:FecR family protein [Chitinophaga jiangningensis]SHM61305.1 FecR family protein [Chitinophaga jiangningensis]
METNELVILSGKYLDGTASDAEKNALLQWYNAYSEAELTAILEAAPHEDEASLEARMLQRLQAATGTGTTTRIHSMRSYIIRVAAAAVIIGAVAGGWLLWKKSQPAHPAIAKVQTGTNAVLVLDDGTEMQLDSSQHGVVSQQGNTVVSRSATTLSYHQQNNNETVVKFNTLKTPRGGQFRLVLPDGTSVWLNAASSITYPTAFTGKERKVSITGEAYFEVAASADNPFTVTANNTDILVLGTRFNVNAYEDEKFTSTTLVQGAVLVRGKTKAQHLLPGQQAQVTATDLQLIKQADVSAAIAWKNGFFSFKDADVPGVMRELARWYNVDIIYSGGIPDGSFTGEMSRTLTLPQVAELMRTTRIHMSITNGGKSITVTPE